MAARVHLSATVPDSGRRQVHTDLIVVWAEDASVEDAEESIKRAARKAVQRVREEIAPTPLPGQLTLPEP